MSWGEGGVAIAVVIAIGIGIERRRASVAASLCDALCGAGAQRFQEGIQGAGARPACPAKPLRRSMGPGRLSISGEYPISNKEYSTSKGSKQKTESRRVNRATPWRATEGAGCVPHGGRRASAAEENRMTDGLPVPKAFCVAASLCDAPGQIVCPRASQLKTQNPKPPLPGPALRTAAIPLTSAGQCPILRD